MRTEQLITVLAADETKSETLERVLPLTVLLVAAVAGTIFLLDMGIRPDLMAALGHLNVVIKHLFPAVLAVGAYATVIRLARPGADLSKGALGLIALGAALLIGAVTMTLLNTPADSWVAAFKGHSRITCLTSVSLMGLAILAGSIWALQRGAPTHPALCGAAAGLLSGGVSATVYALYCIEDSPLFFATWYSLAILAVTAIGAVAGAKFLRW